MPDAHVAASGGCVARIRESVVPVRNPFVLVVCALSLVVACLRRTGRWRVPADGRGVQASLFHAFATASSSNSMFLSMLLPQVFSLFNSGSSGNLFFIHVVTF